MMERLEAYDLGMLYWFNSWRGPWLNPALMFISHLGDLVVILAVLLAGIVLMSVLRQRRLAGILLIVALIGWGIEWGVKLAVDRPRPDISNALVRPSAQPSFPSGHALMTMAVYGSLAMLLRRVNRRLGAALLVGAVAISVVVGLTRVMIGVHYPFDVLVGWIAGLACVTLAQGLAGPSDERTEPEKQIQQP